MLFKNLSEKHLKSISLSLNFFIIAFSIYIIYIGKNIFIPFIIGIVFAYLITLLRETFEKIKIKNWQIPKALAMILAIIAWAEAFYLIYTLITSNITDLIDLAPNYQRKLIFMYNDFASFLGFENNELIDNFLNNLNFQSLFVGLASFVSNIAGVLGMIIVYTIFILVEQKAFHHKLLALFPDKKKSSYMKQFLSEVHKDIKIYIKIKTFVSALTGLFTYFVLLIVGVDFAEFWGLLAFLLNYIPTFGSILAVVFPTLLSLLQFDSLIPFFILASCLFTVQFVLGNILEPKLFSKSLNLSSIVIIISLIIWGNILGVVGMFLCIPIMVIINIILAKFPDTRKIAIFLSKDGNLKDVAVVKMPGQKE